MRKIYSFLLFFIVLGSHYSVRAQVDPQLEWVFNAVNETPLGGNVNGNSIKVDADGNKYVTGNFSGTADFDPSATTANLTSVGNSDIFIAKYDTNGNYLWAKAMGGISTDNPTSIALDASGQVYITGSFAGTADFDSSAATANLTSVGASDIFIAKYDTNGNYMWAKAIGGASSDIATSVALDVSGQVHITGSFGGTADFDPSTTTANFTSVGDQDIFIAKYDTNGNYIWAKAMGGTNYDSATGIALNASGQVHITGNFQGTVDFDPSATTANLTSVGVANDIFIAKYDTNGNYIWAKAIGGTVNDLVYSIALDASGQVHITGIFGGTADFNPSAAAANLTSVGNIDIFIAKYDNNGNYMWAKAMGGTVNDYAYSIALNSSGQVHITGFFFGTADFDPSAATANLTSVGNSDIFIAKYDTNGNYIWAKVIGGTANDSATSIVLDASEQVHITGSFYGTADFDPSGTVENLTGPSNLPNCFVAAYSSDGFYSNALSIGGYPNLGFNEMGRATVTDNLGNVYVTGYFYGNTDFDPSASIANLTSTGGADIFIAKYDADGNYLWAKGVGGMENDDGFSIALDASGQIYVTGFFQGTADFDPSVATANLTTVGLGDIFIAKYDTNGNYIWSKAMGGTNTDLSYEITVDSSGQVYISGFFQDTVDFDPSAATANLISVGGQDIFIAKYDTNGNYIWAKAVGGAGVQNVNSIIIDADDNLICTGYFQGTVDFDPSISINNLTAAGGFDIFIAKYDPNGNYVWAKAISGALSEYSSSIALDNSGQIYITGNFQGTVDFDPSIANANNTSAGGSDIFIAKYNANGEYLWARTMGGSNTEQATSIALDALGNIHLTGVFQGTADFDPSASIVNHTAVGSQDIFIAKYDPTGNYVWANAMGSVGFDSSESITLNSNGEIFVAGGFQQTVDFDPSPDVLTLTASNAQDLFLAKYSVCTVATIPTVTASETTICANGSSTLSITGGTLNSATNWQWYNDACGGTSIGAGTSITVNPITTTTYYVRGEGGCTTPGSCTSITITVEDTTAPVAPTLSDVTAECSATPTAPSANDNCAGMITGTTTTSFPITTQGTTVVTWTFDDGNGNTSTATQNVIIEDTTAPVAPTLSDVTAECSATPTAPSANDNCSGMITGTTTTSFPITTQGTTVVTWTFNDGNGNTSTATQNVIIEDTTAPVSPTLSDVIGQCSATPTAPTATDNCAGTITGTTTTSFPITTQGTTVVTWTFDDGNGNTITATQNVIIEDTTAPVAPTLSNVTEQCSATPTAPTATDNCTGTITGTTTTSFPITTQGTTVVTWTFDDGNGNMSTATQNVIIEDTTAPVAPMLSDVTEQCSATPSAPSATDNCAGTITGTTTTSFPITTQGTTVVTWTFDDGNGNTSTATQNVIIEDTTAPVAPTLSSVTEQCSATPTAPTATDNCSGTITGTTTTSFPITTQGTTVVTWTFEDGNGNTSTATQNVILSNTTDTTVTLSGGTLTAITSADSYQWIDCNNGNAIIPLATNQSFTPTVDGNYAVIITVDGCESISACQAVLDTKDFDFDFIHLYPNPTSDNFVIKLPFLFEKVEVEIHDVMGKKIKQLVFNEQEELHLSLNGVADGVYFVQLRSNQKSKIFKVVKKN